MIAVTTSAIYIFTVLYLSSKSKELLMDYATKVAKSETVSYAQQTAANLGIASQTVTTLAEFFNAYEHIPDIQRRSVFSNIMNDIIENNLSFNSIWTLGEPNLFDNLDSLYEMTTYGTYSGRLRITFKREIGVVKLDETILFDEISIFESPFYKIPKDKKQQISFDPYFNNPEDSISGKLVMSLVSPVYTGDIFICNVGVDIDLQQTNDWIKSIKPMEKGYAFLLDNNARFIAHPNTSLLLKSFKELDAKGFDEYSIDTKIKAAQSFSYIWTDENENEYFLYFEPFTIGSTTTTWSFVTAVPIASIMLNLEKSINNTFIIGIIGIFVLLIFVWLLAGNISVPIQNAATLMEKLSKGEIDKSNALSTNRSDELGTMTRSLNSLLNGFNRTAHFAEEIGDGNLNASFSTMGPNDVLGKALLRMQQSLLAAKEEEVKRIAEDKERNWATHGLAMFSEILRQNNDDLEEFSYQLISNLVKYLNANQGGIFVVNNTEVENIFIEMKAAYAYNQRKFRTGIIEIGEGLVGRCVQENQTIYLTDIPKDYIEITSGLGDAVPTCLLIVPLIHNDFTYGVIEIASFHNIEKHKIEFVEKIGESIASTLSVMKINLKTASLLQESKEATEQMAMQEEEMRQNLEELLATQEELSRKETTLLRELRDANEKEHDLQRENKALRDELQRMKGVYAKKNLNQ